MTDLCIEFAYIFPKMSFNLLQHRHGLGSIHKIDSKSVLAKSSSPSDSVEVGFTLNTIVLLLIVFMIRTSLTIGSPVDIHRKVEVDHDGDLENKVDQVA